MFNPIDQNNNPWNPPKDSTHDIEIGLLNGKKLYVFITDNQELEGYTVLDDTNACEYKDFLQKNKLAIEIQEATNQSFESIKLSFDSLKEPTEESPEPHALLKDSLDSQTTASKTSSENLTLSPRLDPEEVKKVEQIFRQHVPIEERESIFESDLRKSPIESSSLEEYKEAIESLPPLCFSISDFKENLKTNSRGEEISETQLLEQAENDFNRGVVRLNGRVQRDFQLYHKEMTKIAGENAPLVMFAATQTSQGISLGLFHNEILSSKHLSEYLQPIHSLKSGPKRLSSMSNVYSVNYNVSEQKVQIDSYLYIDLDYGEGPEPFKLVKCTFSCDFQADRLDIYISAPRDPGKEISVTRSDFLKDSIFKKTQGFLRRKPLDSIQKDLYEEIENEGLSNLWVSFKSQMLNKDFQEIATLITSELNEESAKKGLCLLSPTFQKHVLSCIHKDLTKHHHNWDVKDEKIEPISLDAVLSHTDFHMDFENTFGSQLCTIKGTTSCIKHIEGKPVGAINIRFKITIDLESDTATFLYAKQNKDLDYEEALPVSPDSSLLENSKPGMCVLKNEEIETLDEFPEDFPVDVLTPLYPHAEIKTLGQRVGQNACEWKMLVSQEGEQGLITFTARPFTSENLQDTPEETKTNAHLCCEWTKATDFQDLI